MTLAAYPLFRRLDLQLRPEEPLMVLRGLAVEHHVAMRVLLRRWRVRAITKRRDRNGATRSPVQQELREQRIRLKVFRRPERQALLPI